MKTHTKELLDRVGEKHDWKEGQVHGGSGTQLSCTDVCRVCALERRWFSDRQNGVDGDYSFFMKGEPISLREAAALDC